MCVCVCVSLEPGGPRHRGLRLEVHVLARKFAAWLRQQGVGKGEVVCVALPNCLERVVADLGTICSGAVAHTYMHVHTLNGGGRGN